MPRSQIVARIALVRRSPLGRYGAAVLLSALATGLTLLLGPVISPSHFQIFLGAVMLTAWWGGYGPALLTTALSAVTGGIIAVLPYPPPVVPVSHAIASVFLFLAVALLLVWLSTALQRATVTIEAIIQASPLAVIALDTEGNVRLWNPAAERIFGWREAEALGRFLPFVAPEQEVEYRGLLRRVLRGEAFTGVEAHWRRRDGSPVDISLSTAPLRDPAGKINGVVGLAADITERKRAEEALYRLAAIVESSDDAIIGLTQDGVITSWNAAAERQYGYAAWEVLGQPVTLLAPPDRKTENPQLLEKIKRGERVAHYETVRVRRDGKQIGISLSVSPIKDAAGRIIGIATITRDITARQQAEERQRFLADAGSILASSLDYEATLERVVQLVIPVLADWCAVDVVEEDGAIRRVATAHRDPAKAPLLDELARRYPALSDSPQPSAVMLRTGKPLLENEVTDAVFAADARDAEYVRMVKELGVHSYMAVPLVARGHTFGAITLARVEAGHRYGPADLELAEELARRAAVAVDNALLYRQAQEANSAKDQFLAVLSHELRNPLSPILAGVEILRRTVVDDGRVHRTLEIIERNARLQARLVNDLLDLSRVTRGKILLRMEPVALDAVVRAAAQAQQSEAAEAGISLRVRAEPGLWVRGDFDRLQQVVLNLLTNAIKFTPAGGEVSVGVFKVQNSKFNVQGSEQPATLNLEPGTLNSELARIVVEDTGIGIPRELLPRLFMMFQQGEVTAGQRKPGLGIGLALVKSLVEMHGGEVWAESAGPGKGSRFTVELPLIAAPAESRQPARYERPAGRIGLLLVEDNPDTRILLQEGLVLAGYEVQAAASAEEALELLRRARPDIILSDIGLPGMDGYAFLRRAREMPGLAAVPAFAVTGYGQDIDVRRAQEAGYTGHFVKPVDVATLDQRIREYLAARV